MADAGARAPPARSPCKPPKDREVPLAMDARNEGDGTELECTVFTVSTASSTYYVALLTAAGHPRGAVLRSVQRADGQSFEVQDDAPSVEGQPLFEVPPSEWLGLHLEFADVVTSPVRAVAVEPDPQVRASFLPAAARPSRDVFAVTARSEVAPPLILEDIVEAESERAGAQGSATVEVAPSHPEALLGLMESAARRLRTVAEAPTFLADLAAQPELQGRFELALAECHLRISALGARAQAARRRGS